MELLAKKEQENYQLYMKERGQRQITGGKSNNMMMHANAKIMSSEVTALQKSAYENDRGVEPIKSRQVVKQISKKTSEDDDDCGIEIEGAISGGSLFGQKPPTSKSLFKEHFP